MSEEDKKAYTTKQKMYLSKLNKEEIKMPKPETLQYYNIYKDGQYNNKCDQTVALIKADDTIPDKCIKITSLKNKPRHLQIKYSYLKNFNNKLIKNNEYKSNWKSGLYKD